jgi:peptidyl-tRNA hydrolase
MKLKMYCVVAKESLDKMKGIRGKMMSMSGHAYAHSVFNSMDYFPEYLRLYRASDHAYKITLVVPTVEDLKVFEKAYKDICGTSLVTDAGFTVFKNEDGERCSVVVCLGIGPIPEDLIGEDLKALKTLT